ncbi:tripartite tricarboxylate transporter substrate binding protein [Elioraea sp.]|uniref:Bug family tripartite tricarboxylate transporter substrate binding protein n=1 Tax=Elioraea sp. TaxID=2185103 RepID=UPI0025B9053B|nr:tripartite tricarboxylate transporter substrate binding protein [Elioraea sp.]
MFRRHLLGALAASAALPGAATASSWPSRPIRLVVTFPPGGGSDIIARLIAPAMQARLGQPVIVDNRPGAGGTLAAAMVAKEAADGHTLLVANNAPIVISPAMFPSVAYDPLGSFRHLAYVGAFPFVLVVRPDVPARTLDELIALARARGGLSYGSGGTGSVGHIVGLMLARDSGAAFEHVPYRGSGPMVTDFLAGVFPMAIDALPQQLQHMRSGAVRAIAVTAPGRVGLIPDVPTMAELGRPGLTGENWVGLSAPAGVPDAVAERIAAVVAEAAALPEVVEKLDAMGLNRAPMPPAAFAAMVTQQVANWQPAIRAAGLTAN